MPDWGRAELWGRAEEEVVGLGRAVVDGERGDDGAALGRPLLLGRLVLGVDGRVVVGRLELGVEGRLVLGRLEVGAAGREVELLGREVELLGREVDVGRLELLPEGFDELAGGAAEARGDSVALVVVVFG